MADDNSFRKLIEKVSAETEVYKTKLPVPEKDLSRVFSKDSLELHYGTLYGNYVKKALAGEGEFQVAGARLHTLFFEQFQAPKSPNNPTGAAQLLINDQYESFTDFKSILTKTALELHGSGWVYMDTKGKLKTIQNHKIVDNVAIIIDMWEHSYILDYGSDKEQYLKSIWSIINWDIINARIN